MSLVVLKLFIYCIALTLVLAIVVLLVDFCVSFACILFVYVCAWVFICVCFDWCLMLFGLVLVCVAVCCLLWIEDVWFVILFVLVESLIGGCYIVVGGCVMLRCCYLCDFVVVGFLFSVCGWFLFWLCFVWIFVCLLLDWFVVLSCFILVWFAWWWLWLWFDYRLCCFLFGVTTCCYLLFNSVAYKSFVCR